MCYIILVLYRLDQGYFGTDYQLNILYFLTVLFLNNPFDSNLLFLQADYLVQLDYVLYLLG